MITITGRLTDSTGISRHEDVTSATAPGGQLIASRSTRFVSLPAVAYLDEQPAVIPLDLHHREIVGELCYLERANGGIYIVATSDADWLLDVDEELYLSPSVVFRVESRGGSLEEGADATLDGVALTTSPATYCQTPIRLAPGDLSRAHDYARCRPGAWQHSASLIEHAQRYCRDHRSGEPLRIVDPNTKPRPTARVANDSPLTTAPPGLLPPGIRYRGDGDILAIR